MGSPTVRAASFSPNSRVNSTATSVWTRNRLAAMQLCPLFWQRAVTATSAAFSRSADGITMNGSLPPSSRTVFFRASPAIAATDWPAALLPVRVAAATRSSRSTRSTVTLRPGADVADEELAAFVRSRLAAFKVPKRFLYGELPKTSTGKVQKNELRGRHGS